MANIEDIQVQMPSGGEKKSYVVAGAILSCSQGSQLSRLKMPVSHGVFVKGKPQMNIMDFKPMDNIMPFGKCSSLSNPTVAQATAANNGVLTPMPCMPVVTMPWLDGKADKLVEGFPALLNKSTNMCMYCGQIKIEDDGQDLGGVSISNGSNACPAPGANAGQAPEGEQTPEGEQPAEERSMWGDFVKGISALGEVPTAVKKAASELPGAVKKASRELPGGMRQAAKELPKGVKQFVKEGYVDPLKEDLATLGDGKFTKEDVFVVGGLILDAVSLGRSRVIQNLHKSVDKAKRNLGKNSDKIEVGNKGTGNTYTPVEYKGTTKVEGQTRDISRRVYQRSDIDWNQVDPETGLTNLELMKKGRPPYWKDGTKVELHHTIQLEPGPMVELPASLHDEYSKILHGLVENGGSFRNNPALEKQYNNFRSKYWRWRARQLEGKE